MPYDQFGNFNPYNYGQPRQQQPQQNVYAFVSGLEGAKQYTIPANQSILLMDNAQPVCYLKQANALGQTSLKCFKLVEVSEDKLVTNGTQNSEVTISLDKNEEFVTLKNTVNSLIKRIEKLEPKGE